jgi:hypothetical protein
VAGFTAPCPARTRETVACETPARLAMSRLVGELFGFDSNVILKIFYVA